MKAQIIHDGDQWLVAIYDMNDRPVRSISAKRKVVATGKALDLMADGVIDQIDIFTKAGEHIQTVAHIRFGEGATTRKAD